MIEKALLSAGYDCEPTVENLIDCYTDFANAYGQDLEDIQDDIDSGYVTVNIMCKRLIRCN